MLFLVLELGNNCSSQNLVCFSKKINIFWDKDKHICATMGKLNTENITRTDIIFRLQIDRTTAAIEQSAYYKHLCPSAPTKTFENDKEQFLVLSKASAQYCRGAYVSHRCGKPRIRCVISSFVLSVQIISTRAQKGKKTKVQFFILRYS